MIWMIVAAALLLAWGIASAVENRPLYWDNNGILRGYAGRPIKVSSVRPDRLPPRR